MSPEMKMTGKRPLDGTSATKPLSQAAKLNLAAMKKFQKALEKDPEVDLTSALPIRYSGRLSELLASAKANGGFDPPVPKRQKEEIPPCPVSHDDPVSIVHPMSEPLKALLGNETSLSNAIMKVFDTSQTIWRNPWDSRFMVLKLNSAIVMKTVRGDRDLTEYTTLQYLDRQNLDVPVPKPHGVLRMGKLLLIFMSFAPGITLEMAWPQLSTANKAHIRDELDAMFRQIRSLPFPDQGQLGGICQEGCIEPVRADRRSEGPIYTAEEFEDFQFSKPKFGSANFVQFLRRLAPDDQVKIVFTHADLRPANITVDVNRDGQYNITAILDWAYSGFYPEYYESTRLTYCLSPQDKSDWYLYLPPCIAPEKYRTRWLLGRLWLRHIE